MIVAVLSSRSFFVSFGDIEGAITFHSREIVVRAEWRGFLGSATYPKLVQLLSTASALYVRLRDVVSCRNTWTVSKPERRGAEVDVRCRECETGRERRMSIRPRDLAWLLHCKRPRLPSRGDAEPILVLRLLHRSELFRFGTANVILWPRPSSPPEDVWLMWKIALVRMNVYKAQSFLFTEIKSHV